MAKIRIYCPEFDILSPPRIIPGGWVDRFPIRIFGPDVLEAQVIDSLEVEFADADIDVQQGAKIRDAARALAARRGFMVSLTDVVSYAPPKRL